MADLLNPQARLEGDNAPTLKDGDSDWLRLATDAYEESETFMDASLRKQWGRNLSNFQSRHPAGSKYHMPAYKFRSRGFRPKTRAMTRNNEATVAAAFFSTQDAVSIVVHHEHFIVVIHRHNEFGAMNGITIKFLSEMDMRAHQAFLNSNDRKRIQ